MDLARGGSSSRIGTLFAALLAASVASGCIQLQLSRDTRLEPLPKGALESLSPGATDLRGALERLGPPLFAWELPDQGIALAWGWYRYRGWNVSVSAPLSDQGGSASFDYASAASSMRGVVLFFDRDLRLNSLRQGLLRDLRARPRTRPQAPAASEELP